MNLTNILTKKNDELGKVLRNAALDPGFRPIFYKTLLESEVYVLTSASINLPHGKTILKIDKEVPILSWKNSSGDLIIPIFSSEKEMRKAIKKNETFIRIKAKVLFSSNFSAQYVLNPLSDYGKELTAQEVQFLLDGSLLHSSQKVKLENDTKILLSQPSEYPHKLTKALSTYFAQNGKISNAYIAQMQNTEADEEPHLILALDGSVDLSNIFSEIAVIIQDTIPPNRYVDMFQIGNNNGLDNYFENIKPFYTA